MLVRSSSIYYVNRTPDYNVKSDITLVSRNVSVFETPHTSFTYIAQTRLWRTAMSFDSLDTSLTSCMGSVLSGPSGLSSQRRSSSLVLLILPARQRTEALSCTTGSDLRTCGTNTRTGFSRCHHRWVILRTVRASTTVCSSMRMPLYWSTTMT